MALGLLLKDIVFRIWQRNNAQDILKMWVPKQDLQIDNVGLYDMWVGKTFQGSTVD